MIKKEIAYHGDVINTSARIQDECNKYNESLLVSETIYNNMKRRQFIFRNLGNILLKGKEEPLKVYSVRLNK